ncbi:MAG: hypothetical protein C0613_00385 [Desulfobulbaceae bacterium]|nr:MAG: hypothetical protein C0613_00385 [Desulfobulbaceae bacterium]
MKRYHWLVIPLALLFVLGISPAPAAPQPPARAYFDVNLGLADKLETRLMLINTTFDQLSAQGLAPQFVVGFRGPASFFVTTGDGYVASADLAAKRKIRQWLRIFTNKGIGLEQCLIAAAMLGINNDDFLTDLTLVDNGYATMVLYQNRGFARIPMD